MEEYLTIAIAGASEEDISTAQPVVKKPKESIT
jgi:hypothetical protein